MKRLPGTLALAALLAGAVELSPIPLVPVGAPRAPHARFDGNAEVDRLIRRACADCHSAETRWPWYNSLPGVSWMVRRVVARARAKLDFSSSAVSANEKEEIVDAASDHSMPPTAYLLMHPEARLTSDDLATFQRWLATQAANR